MMITLTLSSLAFGQTCHTDWNCNEVFVDSAGDIAVGTAIFVFEGDDQLWIVAERTDDAGSSSDHNLYVREVTCDGECSTASFGSWTAIGNTLADDLFTTHSIGGKDLTHNKLHILTRDGPTGTCTTSQLDIVKHVFIDGTGVDSTRDVDVNGSTCYDRVWFSL